MEREEAKQLLELCRPGHEADRQDPALTEALALLETDAELKAWSDEQQAVDARISASLHSIKVPADLKASILAGMRLHQTHPTETGTTAATIPFQPSAQEAATTSRPKPSWLSPWIGIAAVFAIVMVIFNLPKSEPLAATAEQTTLAGLPPVLQFLSHEIDSLKAWQFDKRDDHAENLQTFLASTQAPSPQSIPDCLGKMPTIGCITFEYESAKLSMICFKNGEVYHLITADKATYPDALPTKPEIFQCKDKAFKIWVDGEQVKILTVHGSKEDIPEFI